MNIKYNNMLIIVPIFLVLALILTSVNYTIQKKELMSGLEEEAVSATKATSIFLEHKTDIYAQKEQIQTSIDRIISFGRIKRIIIANDEGTVLKSISEVLKRDEDHQYKYKTARNLKIYTEKNITLYNHSRKIGKSDLTLYITIDATYIKTALEESLYFSAEVVAVLVVLGFIASSILSTITGGNISNLSQFAKALASGDYAEKEQDFVIKEVNDLSNTLSIVQSILKEMLSKTKNSILDNEFFNNEQEISKLYPSKKGNKELINPSVEFQIATIDEKNKKEFYSCWDDEEYIYTFVGEIKSSEKDLSDYVSASSITSVISHNLNKNKFDINKLSKMYDIKSLLVIKFNKKSYKLEQYSIFKDEVTTTNSVLKKDKYYSFYHNIKANQNLQNYISKYSYLKLEELVSDVKTIFEKENSVLLVKV